MSADATVRDYYEALRRGEPLYPYFVEDEAVVKFGVSESLAGYDAVAEGLREQSRRTTDWTVASRDLHVLERETHATFADRVGLAWRDAVAERTYDLDTRWSGTLERDDEEWRFAGMHVSVPADLTGGTIDRDDEADTGSDVPDDEADTWSDVPDDEADPGSDDPDGGPAPGSDRPESDPDERTGPADGGR